jgi:hypothetical protein
MTAYRIKRINADVLVPDASDDAVSVTIPDTKTNGLLRGIVINVPSLTASQARSVSENVTVAESVSAVRT